MHLLHPPSIGQSHDHTQRQGLLGNVVQLCARKKRTMFSEDLTRLLQRSRVFEIDTVLGNYQIYEG